MKDPSKDSTLDDECHDAIRKFIEDLSKDETSLFEATTQSQQLIDDLKNVDERSKSSISRKIAPKLSAFVAGVEQFGGALDVIAGSVSLMSPIWASVRVVLKIAGDYGEYFDKISDMLEEIGYILSCLRRYPRLYPDNEILRDSMVDIFQSIIQFCSKARDVFHQGKKYQSGLRALNPVGLHAAWKLIWKPFKMQFGSIVDQIRSCMVKIDHEVDVAEKELASKERTKADHERQLQTSRWDAMESHQKTVAQFIDQQRIDIMTHWLSPVNAASNHNSATKLRYKGTGLWFLDGLKFKDLVALHNAFLWLYAIPGAGKTILASTVIEWLREHKQSSTVGLAYFYCDYKDKQKQSPTRILSTLLSMLASRNDEVFERIQEFFEKQLKENPAYTPEFDELLNNFSHFLGDSFEEIYIVVDALDESEDRECVACALKTISETCQYSNIFVTSRHEIDIARTYEGLPSTTIEATDVAGDIDLYVTAEVTAKIKARKLKLRDPALADVICETLIKGAQGMFQWVKCQIDQLCKLRNDKAVRNALDDLPKTLHDTYIRILQKVEAENSEDVEMVHRLLKWLVRGVRNLTLEELAECVSINLSEPEDSFDFDAVFTDAEDVLELCGSLVTLTSDGFVSLAHYTVKEFLESSSIKDTMPQFWIGNSDVHTELASVCLAYLTYDDFSGTEDNSGEALVQTFNEYKFLPYAVQAWGFHAHLSDISEDLFDLTMRLLESGEKIGSSYSAWRHIYFYQQKIPRYRLNTPRSSPLYFASLFGLPQAVSALLEAYPDADEEEPMRASAHAGHDEVLKVFLDTRPSIETSILEKCLCIAANHGHERVAQLLLEKGTNPNSRAGHNGSPLQIASLNGRHHVVTLLLDHNADMNVFNQRYGTPLAAAAEKGHLQTFKILLDRGANVNGRGGWYAYPLVSAIVGRNMQIIDTLIQRGADVNALGGRHGCALMAASSMGMLDLIRSLVSHGARVNDENDKGTDGLYAASMAGQLDAVKLLLELGADVNAKGGKHRNALNAASAEGHIKIVECLLDAGAEVDFFDVHYGNSVQIAAYSGHTDVVRVLAEAGVDVNADGGDRGTALVSAAQNGHVEMIQLLCEVGVPIGDTVDMSDAIMVAASKGHIDAVRTLIEMGAALDDCSTMATYPCCTPLEAAASKGRIEMVRLLLELGADVNFMSKKKYGTPLIAASYGGESSTAVAVAELLIDAGADINATARTADKVFCALMGALTHENYDLCVALLERGANVNISYRSYPTPLRKAMTCSDDKFVELLLNHGANINLGSDSTEEQSDDGSDDDTDDSSDEDSDDSSDDDSDKESDDESDDGCVTALQTAVYHGSNEMVRKLIERGAHLSVDIEDAKFFSALQVASFRGDLDKIHILLDAGSDVNQSGGTHGTCLQAAAYKGHLEAVKALIDAGAEVNESQLGSNGSALVAAIDGQEEGNLEIIKLLLERGADVNLPVGPDYEYPLTAASFFDLVDTMEVLIEAGANVNNNGGMYGTALQAAASWGKEDACVVLLGHGADPDIVGGRYGTALQAAYTEGYYVVIDELFNAGASVNIQCGQYGSALGAAIGASCATLVSNLLRYHGANPNAPIRKYGWPLQESIIFRTGIDSTMEILLDVGADVNARGGVYGSALICAAAHGEEETILTLLNAGANVNLEGNRSYPSAVHGAIKNGHLAILKLLVEKGADLSSMNDRYSSPVELAARKLDFSIFSYLLKRGADINPTGKGKYHNALQAASVSGNKAVIKALLRHGFDINTIGGKFGTALTAAILHGNLDIAELLLKRGINPNGPGGVYSGALQAAAATGSLTGTLLLLRHGADIHKIGGKYHTVLQAAAVSGNSDLLHLLLERGAKVEVLGGHYFSALHAAALVSWPDGCETLMKNGAEWSLVDRKLNHIADWRYETATGNLEDCRERQEQGWPDSDSEWEDDNENSEDDDDDDDEGGRKKKTRRRRRI
ncbi:hypothetical protein N7456_009117 [Penicillium angulare]|uniref:NACHT domain-containing protein n=1 Tax=Penicillium angulare TaxID=116970 RepID=A0A9W9K5F2_9EURO|nr:hypothetical protein N7456_009117 [Penicillium angulare]